MAFCAMAEDTKRACMVPGGNRATHPSIHGMGTGVHGIGARQGILVGVNATQLVRVTLPLQGWTGRRGEKDRNPRSRHVSRHPKQPLDAGSNAGTHIMVSLARDIIGSLEHLGCPRHSQEPFEASNFCALCPSPWGWPVARLDAAAESCPGRGGS